MEPSPNMRISSPTLMSTLSISVNESTLAEDGSGVLCPMQSKENTKLLVSMIGCSAINRKLLSFVDQTVRLGLLEGIVKFMIVKLNCKTTPISDIQKGFVDRSSTVTFRFPSAKMPVSPSKIPDGVV